MLPGSGFGAGGFHQGVPVIIAVAGSFRVFVHIAVAADGAGIGGESLFRTGWRRYRRAVAVAGGAQHGYVLLFAAGIAHHALLAVHGTGGFCAEGVENTAGKGYQVQFHGSEGGIDDSGTAGKDLGMGLGRGQALPFDIDQVHFCIGAVLVDVREFYGSFVKGGVDHHHAAGFRKPFGRGDFQAGIDLRVILHGKVRSRHTRIFFQNQEGSLLLSHGGGQVRQVQVRIVRDRRFLFQGQVPADGAGLIGHQVHGIDIGSGRFHSGFGIRIPDHLQHKVHQVVAAHRLHGGIGYLHQARNVCVYGRDRSFHSHFTAEGDGFQGEQLAVIFQLEVAAGEAPPAGIDQGHVYRIPLVIGGAVGKTQTHAEVSRAGGAILHRHSAGAPGDLHGIQVHVMGIAHGGQHPVGAGCRVGIHREPQPQEPSVFADAGEPGGAELNDAGSLVIDGHQAAGKQAAVGHGGKGQILTVVIDFQIQGSQIGKPGCFYIYIAAVSGVGFGGANGNGRAFRGSRRGGNQLKDQAQRHQQRRDSFHFHHPLPQGMFRSPTLPLT